METLLIGRCTICGSPIYEVLCSSVPMYTCCCDHPGAKRLCEEMNGSGIVKQVNDG